MDDENFIRSNISALLSAPKVKVKTGEIGGEWKLNEIHYIHGMPRNIEFSAILENGPAFIHVMAKINRQSAKLSISEVSDF
jgi:hypothetical protein